MHGGVVKYSNIADIWECRCDSADVGLGILNDIGQ